MSGVLLRRGNLEHRDIHREERALCKLKQRMSDAVTSQ